MQEFVDRTGLPGPRSWSNQIFPDGQADHPLTGITWYEAAAYAAFRGKCLPTIFQWEKAARNGANNPLGVTMPWGLWQGSIAGRANLATSSTVPVGKMEFGMSPFGCYEMAGNVSEWCLNETSEGFIASGGSWASLSQAWGYFGIYPSFQHSNQIGFRCVLNASDAKGDQGAMRIDIDVEVPQFTPAPEAEVRTWFAHYEYDKDVPLDARVVDRAETNDWWREKIEYNGADGERAIAYLYLPKHFPGPHQVIHLMPAGDVGFRLRTVPQSIEADYGAFVRSGRAVFAVVLRGYLERDLPTGWMGPDPFTIEYVEAKARHIIDLRRGLDYLLARGDVDASGVAFLGSSLGSPMMVQPAIEPRYRAVILSGAAIAKADARRHPAANAINFAPLIRSPKLLVHGRYDESAPLRTSAEPLFKLLTEPKRIILFDGGHCPDPEFLVPEVNTWLDKTLGPVKRGGHSRSE
jgi:dienelactone hydrolase